MAPASEEDRRAQERQRAALASLENTEVGTEADRAAAIEAADAARDAAGLPPLKTETEFHRKAVERGLVRR